LKAVADREEAGVSSKLWSVPALVAIAAGCGGGHVPIVGGIKRMPWDEALVAPARPTTTTEWALGEVTEVSPDGSTLTVKLTRGSVRDGDQVNVFLKSETDPGMHYLDSEVRETRAARGTVVKTSGGAFSATVTDSTRHAPIQPGDRVVVGTP
jgi:hypothetical protein